MPLPLAIMPPILLALSLRSPPTPADTTECKSSAPDITEEAEAREAANDEFELWRMAFRVAVPWDGWVLSGSAPSPVVVEAEAEAEAPPLSSTAASPLVFATLVCRWGGAES